MTASMRVGCCIAGGGPAGMMLGLLLARAGVEVLVLEKHADFLRDFRGDTIHPSTLEVIAELGELDALLELPHSRVERLAVDFDGELFAVADFRRLPVRCRYLMFLPQWDFLDFLASRARRHPCFTLRMQTRVQRLIERDGRVIGVQAQTPDGPLDVNADLVIAADGRDSTLRPAAGLASIDCGAPIDVVWFRLPRRTSAAETTGGHIGGGRFLVTIDRGDFWQCGYVVAKGGFAALRAGGLDAFRASLATLAPALADAIGALAAWEDVKLLTVQVNRMPRWWRDGLLCIGDAAHAMSPVGGIGINLAIQDAVAAANLLAAPLAGGRLAPEHLQAVQRRRDWPTRLTQHAQIAIQNRILVPLLAGGRAVREAPLALRLLCRFPLLQRVPARLIGLGVRPEHLR